jgi:hypothetical protein
LAVTQALDPNPIEAFKVLRFSQLQPRKAAQVSISASIIIFSTYIFFDSCQKYVFGMILQADCRSGYKFYSREDFLQPGRQPLMLLFRLMKRLLLIFLLAIVPFQASWAVVATYCQHEKEVTTRHFGHHQHQHEHQHEHQHAQAEEQQKDSTIKFHTDCLTCHGLAAAMVTPPVGTLPIEPLSLGSNSADSYLESIPSPRPEKPQWAHAV